MPKPGEGEKPTEGLEASTEGLSEGTDRLPTGEKYTCSVCKKLVEPITIDTQRGPRYKCPECKKFMKPLTAVEVKAMEETDAGPLPPTELEMCDRVKVLLAEYLPRVYGIPAQHSKRRIGAMVDTLSPTTACDPWNLHNHVKNFAPNASDRHLEAIITKIFSQLEVEGYRISGPKYQPRYSPVGQGGYPGQGYGQRYGQGDGFYSAWPRGQQGLPPTRPKVMKVVVDGQEIVTDMPGYMAWERWKKEQKKDKAEEEARKAEEKRRQDAHGMEMDKFKAEIKKITGETGGSSKETLVDVKYGDQTIKVPASLAPLYMKKTEDPEMKSLRDKVDTLTTKLDDKKEADHKKEMDGVKGELANISRKLENQPTFEEQLTAFDKIAAQRGYSSTGKSTLDVVSLGLEKADQRAQQLLSRMPGGGEFKPEITRTPEERKRKAGEIEKKIEKKEGVLKSEDDLITAAAQLG